MGNTEKDILRAGKKDARNCKFDILNTEGTKGPVLSQSDCHTRGIRDTN